MDIVSQDQARHIAQEVGFTGVGFVEGFQALTPGPARAGRGEIEFPRFGVDRQEDIKGIQPEVHGTAGRVQQADFTRVLAGAGYYHLIRSERH